MSDSVAIDALPYYDRGYDEPGVRQAAVQLVEEEMQRYRPTKNYLAEFPAPGTTLHRFFPINSSIRIFQILR